MSDKESDERRVTATQRLAIEKMARGAGYAAKLARAQELMPFRDLPQKTRHVAAWLLTIKELVRFYEKPASSIQGSIQVLKPGRSIAGILDMRRIRTLEEFAKAIAQIFCGYTDTDEIRELRALEWQLVCSELAGYNSVGPAAHTYTHKRTMKDRVSGRGSIDLLAYVSERRRNGNGKKLDVENAGFVIQVVEALGYKSELARTYQTAHDEVLREETQRALDESGQKPQKKLWRWGRGSE